ncbi:MAG: EAL domain-containing protein [Clostridia bacterium]|nr:EAL domain-containing protein [Clostridia bacterium]
MEKSRRPTLLQLQVSLPKKIAVTAGIMLILIFFVYRFAVPNPNMILIAGLVLCSALFGFGGGIVAAAIMLGYTLFFFSTDHSLIHFTPQNLQKVAVSLFGVAADMLLVCFLKQSELRAFGEVDALTKALHRENALLQRMSLTDALTGLRNRMALRQDYDSFLGREVAVMMLDLNDFKHINDTYGHDEGDRKLRQTGKLLTETFGEACCYRYGGDEFLVIAPDISESDFQQKLDALMRARPMIDDNERVGFSVGCVRGAVTDDARLRNFISGADEKMYEAKRDKARPPMPEAELMQPRTRAAEYTVGQMREYLRDMSGKYDLARVVDPIECRILDFMDDGRISRSESCYGIWNAEQKCINCSSALACRTGCPQEKAEHFQDQVYFIQSNPVALKLEDGSVYDAVVELVNIEQHSARAANDRAAENIGARAAHYLAHHDRLTNVLNADAFHELAREMIANSPGVSWVMVSANIMNFNLVNALFGVNRGNEVLVKTAALLREISEDTRGLCGRLGGDQFALLLPGARFNEEALHNAARVLSEVFNSGIYTFCMHFGVYPIDDPSIPVSVMCGRANSALRTIRDDMTRTVARFDDAMLDRILMEQKVIGSFEEALNGGQFTMYLQPLVGPDGAIIGAEALARWRTPDGAVVTPQDFIETLENAGLIHKLDAYMWEQAVKRLDVWKGTAMEGLTISVNMSAKDFYSIDVYDVLTGLVDRYGVDSDKLRLEITETALLVEPDKSDAVVSRLRERGFLVEIDDFGKGYSSLGLLKSIRADVIKIDMSFLQEIKDRERSRIILQSVIGLAEALGMEVITEGVETEQQLNALTAMGCSHFQGYYFSRPVPAEEFEALYSTSR